MVFNIGETNSIANHFLRSLRDPILQKDKDSFRKNVERLGAIMAYEISKKLEFEPVTVQTPLGQVNTFLLRKSPVLITVLRAGIPYFSGFQHFFTESDCGFIGAYRKEDDEVTIQLDYVAAPSMKERVLILIDPMLATGKSFVKSLNALEKYGKPGHLHMAALIAAPEGIRYIQQHVNMPYTLWTFAIDEALNHQSYIVPGLGDAGDLSYGEKL
jgi:uracil phosphoribosyltransferase